MLIQFDSPALKPYRVYHSIQVPLSRGCFPLSLMEVISDALRQTFMPQREYESFREEEKAWRKLQRPLIMGFMGVIWLVIIVGTAISLNIVFGDDDGKRPFCSNRTLPPTEISMNSESDSDSDLDSLFLTDQEIVDYYWIVLFIPSIIIFLVSAVYLIAGIFVAYSAPTRHGCLKVVENNYCASRRGGVRCLSILNIIFAIIFGLFAYFLGSSLLALESNCSVPLFWCYEAASWGLVVLYGGTAYCLRRKAAVVLDEGEFTDENLGLEMLEANPIQVTPEVEERVNEGFKAWMGSSILSSEEEDEPDSHVEISHEQT